jgi:hypothetical protein
MYHQMVEIGDGYFSIAVFLGITYFNFFGIDGCLQ